MTKVAEQTWGQFMKETYRPRSEPRPDIAAELARAASLKRNAALEEYVARQDERRANAAKRQRTINTVAALILAAIVSVVLAFSIAESGALTEAQRQMLAAHPQDN